MFTTGGGRPPSGGRQAGMHHHHREKNKKNLPASGRPQAGRRPARRYTSSWPSGRPARFLARRYTTLGSLLGPKVGRKSEETPYTCRLWSKNEVILGAPEAALEPGRTSTWAQARPAGGRRICFIFLVVVLGLAGPRPGGRQAPCPPRERGQSVVNNYDKRLDLPPLLARRLQRGLRAYPSPQSVR